MHAAAVVHCGAAAQTSKAHRPLSNRGRPLANPGDQGPSSHGERELTPVEEAPPLSSWSSCCPLQTEWSHPYAQAVGRKNSVHATSDTSTARRM
eukprot:10226431-Heterocapsa_arctica.AAC.2